MSKVTSKLQVTLPKALAQKYGIEPGSEIEFEPAGNVILIRPRDAVPRLSVEQRLALFDATTAWLDKRKRPRSRAKDRGWTREELYGDRGLAR
jgi:AbrB family looped-hinge helix DNA binding protein